MDIITLARKRDMTCDLYLKHNMPAVEWKLNKLINKDKNLINKFPQYWRHLYKSDTHPFIMIRIISILKNFYEINFSGLCTRLLKNILLYV